MNNVSKITSGYLPEELFEAGYQLMKSIYESNIGPLDEEALNAPVEYMDFEWTVKDYLLETLCRLVMERESFSGKRPLGNSDWEDVIYAAWVESKHIPDGLSSERFRDLLTELICDWM